MMRNREAIVLAGGFVTRLSYVVSDVPKPMAPVSGRPFLRYILDMLAENGFSRVVVADGYKREVIEDYFGSSYRGMQLVYSSEAKPLLTGGAVRRAFAHCNSDWVFVVNGDTYLEADFSALENAMNFAGTDAVGVLAAKEMQDSGRYGTMEVSAEGVITAFHEKRLCREGVINAGVYYLSRGSLSDRPEIFSLETDFFEDIVRGGSLRAVICDGKFIDIGIPEDYEKAQDLFESYPKHWRLALFDRDGTLNVDTGHLYEPKKLEFIDAGVELLKRYSLDARYKIVVVTNQAGIAKGLYSESEMRHFHSVFESELEKRGCRVDAWYFCPHHPEYTGPCSCRKPAPGMVEKAIADFESDPSECVMYGDKRSDILAAEAAGVRGVLVEWAKQSD